jgi:hypothetical protein
MVLSRVDTLSTASPFVVDTAAAVRMGVVSGRDDTASMLVRVADAKVLRSGTIVVADDYRGELRFYTRYGVFAKSVRDHSNGAGSYAFVRALHTRGDTLVVGTSTGVTLVSATGAFLSATPPMRGDLLGVLQTGRYLIRRTSDETSAFQGQKGVVKSLLQDTLFFVDPRGVAGGRVAVLPSRIHVSLFNPDPNPLVFPITFMESPFEPESYYAVARTGFYFTDGQNMEVRLYSTAGRITRIIRLEVASPVLLPAMIDTWHAAVLRKYPVVDTRRYVEWALGQYPAPRRVPHIRALKLAADGRIWVREHEYPASDMARWRVFSAEGVYEGVVQLPSRWTVHQIENDFILASEAAAGGERIVSLYNLRATSSAGGAAPTRTR